jgi:hypothetical protein
LQFIPNPTRGLLLLVAGLAILAVGLWHLSDVVIISFEGLEHASGSVVIGYRRDRPPYMTILSGGAGMLTLSALSAHARQMVCITPLQEPIEYYYRASSLFHSQNVHYVVPTPSSPRVMAELDYGTIMNVMRVDHHDHLSRRHVVRLFLAQADDDDYTAYSGNGPAATTTALVPTQSLAQLPLTRPARDAIMKADVIVLGPGSLFESILPNLLIDDLRDAMQQSKATKIYVCNLMTEPGLTSGFSVSDYIRQIKQYGGFTPDYTLVNAQRIDPEVQRIYAMAYQAPVYLNLEEQEETTVPRDEGVTRSQLILEGSVVVEADLASSVVQYNASISNPGQSWTVRVLRHDPEKLTTAILALLRQE